MTLNGRNVTLAEINKIYEARHKNFNEDRPMLSAEKGRPMIIVPRDIKYMCMDIRGGSNGEGASSTISGNFEHEFCGRAAWRIYTIGTCRCELLATS